jgi:hypothetical protein
MAVRFCEVAVPTLHERPNAMNDTLLPIWIRTGPSYAAPGRRVDDASGTSREWLGNV